jgi:hypothetical protein
MIDNSIKYVANFMWGLLAFQYNVIQHELILTELETTPVEISRNWAPAQDVINNFKDLADQSPAAQKFEQVVRALSQEDLKADERIKADEEHKKQLEYAEKGMEGAYDAAKEQLEKELEEEKERAITKDAQRAAEVIEKETDEINKEIAAERAISEQEKAELEGIFAQERQDLETKLKGNEESYFQRHPELSADDRKDIEETTFKAIRAEEFGALENRQAERLVGLQGRQEAHRQDLAERRRELEGTRAER